MSYPDLPVFYENWSYDSNTMKGITARQAEWAALMALDFWENLFYQQEHGILPQPLWNHWRADIVRAAKLSGFQSFWGSVKSRYYDNFVKFVDSVKTV